MHNALKNTVPLASVSVFFIRSIKILISLSLESMPPYLNADNRIIEYMKKVC